MRRPILRYLDSLPTSDVPFTTGARTSIATRLRWSYLISSTLPLLIVGAILLRINTDAQERSIYNDQKNLASGISRSIANYVGDLRQQLKTYMLIVRPGSTELDQWEEDAISLQLRNYPKIIEIAVLDLSGREVVHIRSGQPLPAEQLRFLGEEPIVKNALVGQATYSPITFNQDMARTFTVTMPLPNDAGAIIGVLRAEIRADAIIQEVRAATANSGNYAYIVQSEQGNVVLDDGLPDFVAPPDLRKLLTSRTGTAQYPGARNQEVIGAVAPVILPHDNQAIGWLVIVELPSRTALANVQRTIPVLALLVLLVGMLALLWAFWQARDFLRPLAAMRAGALAIAAGHLEHRIDHPSNDELGDLARTFNQMAEQLQHSLAEIEQQNDRLRQGLALARDIQVGLLPDRAPWNSESIDVYARSIPAYEVGGDFYTYLALAEGRAAIAIGDISGKGVGAALLMALTSSTIESQARQVERPAGVLTTLNELLAPRLKANHMNAALLFAVIDPHENVLRVANAGMIAPVVITSQGSSFVEVGGLPVGAFQGAIYKEAQVNIGPGDIILLVSDGVVEAHNKQGELFGFERLEQIIAEIHPLDDIRTLVELILERVHDFMGDAEQHDDITIVAVRPALSAEMLSLPQNEERTTSYATV